MKYENIELPDDIYCLSDEAKQLFYFLSCVTDDDHYTKFADLWFYDARKLLADYPDTPLGLLVKRTYTHTDNGIARYT